MLSSQEDDNTQVGYRLLAINTFYKVIVQFMDIHNAAVASLVDFFNILICKVFPFLEAIGLSWESLRITFKSVKV